MFGKNTLAKPNTSSDEVVVNSIFYTLQGEGPFSGMPAIFIRLSGCNLKCFFCDTSFESGTAWSAVFLVNHLARQYDFKGRKQLVVLTGGEPMLQDGVAKLIDILLIEFDCIIQIETAGTVCSDAWIKMFKTWSADVFDDDPTPLYVVVSPKTKKINPIVRKIADYWKYIIQFDKVGEDGLPVMDTQGTGKVVQLARPDFDKVERQNIFVSPCDEYDEVKNNANLHKVKDIALKHGYRMTIQLHKLLGLP